MFCMRSSVNWVHNEVTPSMGSEVRRAGSTRVECSHSNGWRFLPVRGSGRERMGKSSTKKRKLTDGGRSSVRSSNQQLLLLSNKHGKPTLPSPTLNPPKSHRSHSECSTTSQHIPPTDLNDIRVRPETDITTTRNPSERFWMMNR